MNVFINISKNYSCNYFTLRL